MKYDEKTGKPIPESRSDEIKMAMERLNEIRKTTEGQNDKILEICNMLCDISISLGLVVDIIGMLYNRIVKEGAKENDERSAEDTGSVE